MKIGILGCRGIPNQYGGFEEFAEVLSAGLAQKGHQVFVYNSSVHPYREKKFGEVNIVHCRDAESWMGTAGQFFYDRNCLDDARQRNFDVLLHLGYTSDSIWWRKWKKMKETRHLVNMDGLEWKRAKYNWLTRLFLKKAEALAARHADQLIADSPAIADHLFNMYNKKAVFIPYGAVIFDQPDLHVISRFEIKPFEYFLLIARMEPENNIETIIQGVLSSRRSEPLLIVGNTSNAFGKKLRKKYTGSRIRFMGVVYDKTVLNNLRYHSHTYFHGHSVGGTNPSLLEAMACQCNIVAHDNVFNRAVLGNDAAYFSTADSLTTQIELSDPKESQEKKEANLRKIKEEYNWPAIIDAYEKLMLDAALGR